MKKVLFIPLLIILLLTGCKEAKEVEEENDIFSAQITHEKLHELNKLYMCTRTETDNDGVIIKTDETIELDPNNTLVKYGTIMSQYTKEKYDYYCKIVNDAKNNLQENDKGHYYIVNCNKEHDLISGGQFYIPDEMNEKKDYYMSNLIKYIDEYNIFDIRKWKEDLTSFKYICK